MNKYEFLDQLEDQLRGQVSYREVRESVDYYSKYIDEEVRAGRSEQEVLDSLGSANSIARSIIEAQGGEYEGGIIYEEDGNAYDGSYERENGNTSVKMYSTNGWKAKLIIGGIILVIFLILALAFKVFIALIPFILPIAIILFVIRLFEKR